MNQEQKTDRLRILEIIHEAHASHIGSCLSAVDIISAIYNAKRPDDRFILSAGHSAVALYAVLERKGLLKNPNLHDLNVHPDRSLENHIDVSTGSLGQGLPIAVGMALADRNKNVWCVTTDGELNEGSMWEAIRIAGEQKLTNLHLAVNVNGYTAYKYSNKFEWGPRFKEFGWEIYNVDGHNPKELEEGLSLNSEKPRAIIAYTDSEQLPFLQGLDAHYHVMTDEEYAQARLLLR